MGGPAGVDGDIEVLLVCWVCASAKPDIFSASDCDVEAALSLGRVEVGGCCCSPWNRFKSLWHWVQLD